MAGFNTAYLQTNRGIIKILQIVFGFVCCSLLCGNWYGGKACFYNDVLNLLDILVRRMERVYSVIGVVLFIVAFGLLVWFLLQDSHWPGNLIAATNSELALHVFFIGIQLVLFIWDYQILHGQAYN